MHKKQLIKVDVQGRKKFAGICRLAKQRKNTISKYSQNK